MSDPSPPPAPLPPPFNSKLPPAPPPNRGLGWFFAISGGIVLFLTLGCVLAVSDGKLFSEDGAMALVCGSPTLLLGGIFLWLGTRRLKR
jgi:peptidoglycan/LPS O-acetylase OafA/YrhL